MSPQPGSFTEFMPGVTNTSAKVKKPGSFQEFVPQAPALPNAPTAKPIGDTRPIGVKLPEPQNYTPQMARQNQGNRFGSIGSALPQQPNMGASGQYQGIGYAPQIGGVPNNQSTVNQSGPSPVVAPNQNASAPPLVGQGNRMDPSGATSGSNQFADILNALLRQVNPTPNIDVPRMDNPRSSGRKVR